MSKIIVGIDPGAKNVGVCVRKGNTILLSSTYCRPDSVPQVMWATLAVKKFEEEVLTQFKEQDLLFGIEDVTSPSAYMGGKLQLLNPSNTIKLAIVVGAFALRFPQAVIIRPSKNGSQASDTYPPELVGRRPAELLGSNNAGTRDHERSAFDIAGLVESKLAEGYVLDMQTPAITTELLNLPLKSSKSVKRKKVVKPETQATELSKPEKAKTNLKPEKLVALKRTPPTSKENNLTRNNLFGEYL